MMIYVNDETINIVGLIEFGYKKAELKYYT